MPAVTRSQRKNSVTNVPIVNRASDVVPIRNCVKLTITIPSPMMDAKALFVSEMKELLKLCEVVEGKENKMKIAMKIYELNNNKLPQLISCNGLDTWIIFMATAYNKTTEFYKECEMGNYAQLDKNLVEKFLHNLEIYRKMTTDIIKNYNGIKSHPHLNEAKAEILRDVSTPSTRPRRNIRRVNYAGMDSIEPECEFDGITDIWADLTLEEDPDYIFEDDEDDEVEEIDAKEQICEKIWANVYPQAEVESSSRPRRNRKPVSYAGMDMNEDDEGYINVAKRWFENGKVTHFWRKYAMSQANEIGDEDYVYEE